MRPANLLVLLLFFMAFPAQAAELIIQSVKTEKIPSQLEDSAWAKAKAIQIPLSKQTMVSPRGGGSASFLEVKSLYSAGKIAFLLRWKDDAKNSQWDTSGKFTDACAVQFPMRPGQIPSPFMGEKESPVNIWRWRAIAQEQEKERFPQAYADFHRRDAIETTAPFFDKPVENLTAQGFGTLARRTQQDVEGIGEWKNGEWMVVLKRKLSSPSGTLFKENIAIQVAFAVWDGANQERDGMKSVAFWQWLVIGNAKIPSPKSETEKGKLVFARYGCATCHGPAGKGGVQNLNSQGGQVPSINRVAEGFTEEEVKAVIYNGRVSQPEDSKGPIPSLHMNSWESVMDEAELDVLVKYLFNLLPKGKTEEW